MTSSLTDSDMIFNGHVAPCELVVHVTYHVTIDMSVTHVSFPLRKFQSPPFQKELVEGQSQSLAMTSNAVPDSGKKLVGVVNVKSLNVSVLAVTLKIPGFAPDFTVDSCAKIIRVQRLLFFALYHFFLKVFLQLA